MSVGSTEHVQGSAYDPKVYIFLIRITSRVDLAMSVCPSVRMSFLRSASLFQQGEYGDFLKFKVHFICSVVGRNGSDNHIPRLSYEWSEK